MITRRHLMTTALGSFALGLAAPASLAQTMEYLPFDRDDIGQRLADGEVLLLHFVSADCSVCTRQRQFIDDIRLLNPSFNTVMKFVSVDWAINFNLPMLQTMGIDRQATIVLLDGNAEVGRLEGTSDRAAIHDLMELAFLSVG